MTEINDYLVLLSVSVLKFYDARVYLQHCLMRVGIVLGILEIKHNKLQFFSCVIFCYLFLSCLFPLPIVLFTVSLSLASVISLSTLIMLPALIDSFSDS